MLHAKNVTPLIDPEQFWRDGYSIVRGAFSPEQVVRWRKAALDAPDRSIDLLTNDVLREIIWNETIQSIAEAILESKPIYFGDSSINIGSNKGGFHKDNADRYDGRAPDWSTDRYPIIRFGIYTQSHSDTEPGGLDLRRGSHMHPDVTTGQHKALDTTPGDLVVWSLRTTHSADSRILKFGYRRIDPGSLAGRILRKVPAEGLMVPSNEERVALFASFGGDSPLLDRYIAYLKTRTYVVRRSQACHWTDETRRLLQEKGVAFIDMTGLDATGPLNDDYKQLPY